MKSSTFEFHPVGINPPDDCGYVAHIPKGVSDKRTLLELFATLLYFPSYFGFNWDAFDECLADLSWLQEPLVCIWHDDIPLSSDPVEARRYLKVLDGILRSSCNVPLRISFPDAVKNEVQALLA